MKTHSYMFSYTVYENEKEIPEDTYRLICKAMEARKNAYAPYSDFMVGAAVLMEDGSIYIGNNQENAAYPSGLCAERVAIYHAASSSPQHKILKIAICGGSSRAENSIPTAPCGACRQSLLEYEEKQSSPIEVIFCGVKPSPAVSVESVKNILPFTFGKSYLEKNK